MTKSKTILTAAEVKKTIRQLARSMADDQPGVAHLALVGIQTRGVPLAQRIQQELKQLSKTEVPLGTLDITLYRDDLATVGPAPIVRATDIKFDLTDKVVVLVDDVLFTGRTIRAALNELSDFGRPRRIQLAALIDRGHRELPIHADYVGKKITTKRSEIIEVKLKETDGVDEVRLR